MTDNQAGLALTCNQITAGVVPPELSPVCGPFLRASTLAAVAVNKDRMFGCVATIKLTQQSLSFISYLNFTD